MLRIPALLIVLALAVPGAAFGQGAGDDQYQDPFADTPAQGGGGGSGGGGGGDGLSETPPSDGGSSSSGVPAPTAPATPSTAAAPQTAAGELPNTGANPYLLALFGVSLLMIGVGVRLRTIDPNAY